MTRIDPSERNLNPLSMISWLDFKIYVYKKYMYIIERSCCLSSSTHKSKIDRKTQVVSAHKRKVAKMGHINTRKISVTYRQRKHGLTLVTLLVSLFCLYEVLNLFQ